LPEDPINVKLPDGTVKQGVKGKTTPYDIALGISKGLAEHAVVAKVDGKGWDLKRPLEGNLYCWNINIYFLVLVSVFLFVIAEMKTNSYVSVRRLRSRALQV
jgi:hypothetical protein